MAVNVFHFCVSTAVVCSATVIDYDKMVGDLLFYNQTLEFSLRDDEAHGVELLRLIENLMAPWDVDAIVGNSTADNGRIGSTDVGTVARSRFLVRSVMMAGAVSFFLFFATIAFVLLNLPFTVHLKVKFMKTCYGNGDETDSSSYGHRNSVGTSSSATYVSEK